MSDAMATYQDQIMTASLRGKSPAQLKLWRQTKDRMKEADLDYEFRTLTLGHENKRPEYGTGGSMEFRRAQLLKIVHPIPAGFFATFDAAYAA